MSIYHIKMMRGRRGAKIKRERVRETKRKRQQMKESESHFAESALCSSHSPHRKRINTVWGGRLN